MKILVVHHEVATCRRLVTVLEKDGHQVLTAASGAEAASRFDRNQPDLVLLDVALADMDGYRCARNLNTLAGGRFVPVMLMTAVSDHDSLDRFLESGAMDFIPDPLDRVALRAKIGGFERIRELYAHVESLQVRSSHEVLLAKQMFDSVVSRSPRDIDFLRHWSLSAGHFSGDMLIYEKTPEGDLHVLMADFTGHGLSAAIGALPASDAFFAMSRKGLGIAAIAREINRKLNTLLPVGHFCAASLIRLCPRKAVLEAWIGGQPPVWLFGEGVDDRQEIDSFHLPLGVLGDEDFSGETRLLALDNVQHLMLFSDGLLEARNAQGHVFGEEGLSQAVDQAMTARRHVLQQVKSSLVSFLGGLEPHDDVSLMTVSLTA